MSDNQKPQGDTNWIAKSFAVEPGMTPDDLDDLLQTVIELTSGSNHFWSGTSKKILEAANEKNRLRNITPKQVNLGIWALQERFDANGVKHLLFGAKAEGLQNAFMKWR